MAKKSPEPAAKKPTVAEPTKPAKTATKPATDTAAKGQSAPIEPVAEVNITKAPAKTAAKSATKTAAKSAATEVATSVKVRARLNSKVWRATSEVVKAVSLPKRPGFAKLESIPVFAEGYALGDLVMTDNSRDHFILDVVERSGNSTYRVKFLDRWPDRQTYDAFWARYAAMGCTANPMESVMMLAINSPPGVEPRKIADMLTKDQANYDLEFEITYQHGSK